MNKFWNRAKGHNHVTTRARGDIPGILVAKDVFISIPEIEMQAATAARASKYCDLIDDLINGKIKYRDFRNNVFFNRDVLLSPIHNPSTPYKKDY